MYFQCYHPVSFEEAAELLAFAFQCKYLLQSCGSLKLMFWVPGLEKTAKMFAATAILGLGNSIGTLFSTTKIPVGILRCGDSLSVK